jgi:hypothetical protein
MGAVCMFIVGLIVIMWIAFFYTENILFTLEGLAHLIIRGQYDR